MALAGRSSRRGGGRRWLIVGLVLTIVVVLIDASIKSESPTAGRQLAAQQWIDRVSTLVTDSNVQGLDLAGIRTGSTPSSSSTQLRTQLQTLSSGTESTLHQLERIRPPTSVTAAAALLQTCLQIRAEATGSLVRAIDTVLSAESSGGTSATAAAAPGATSTAAAAVQRLQVADQAYQLFTQDLPSSLDVKAPPSVWITQVDLYSQADLEVFLEQLPSRLTAAAQNRVSLVTVSTTPAELRLGPGGLRVLAPSPTVTATVVVGDIGNQNVSNLTIKATLDRAVGTASAETAVSLAPGQATTVTLGPLAPPQGTPFTLTVIVDPPTSSPLPVQTTTLDLELPSPNSVVPTPTTSTSTTTLPHHPAGKKGTRATTSTTTPTT